MTDTENETETPAREYAIGDRQAAQIENAFTYHAPKPDQLPRYEELRHSAKDLAQRIVRRTPPSREQSLALTHLEDAVMWANAAIARNE